LSSDYPGSFNRYPPIVCGCMPPCKSDEILVVDGGEGVWSDGSQKGSFECLKNDENLPSRFSQ